MRQNIIIFFLGVVLGLVPMYLENRRLKDTYQESRQALETDATTARTELSEVQEKYRVALLRDQISSLILEVEQDNFGSARLQSTNLFNRIRDTLPETETPAVRQALHDLLERRDDVTAALVSNDNRIATQLREIYESFPRATTLAPPTKQDNAVAQQAETPVPPAAVPAH